MPRTIEVAGPAGLNLPSIDLVNAADTVIEAVTLIEQTNAKGKYVGTLTLVGGTYTGIFKSDTTVMGTFLELIVSGSDPETVLVGDPAVPQYVQRLGMDVTRTHRTSGDTLPENVVEG